MAYVTEELGLGLDLRAAGQQAGTVAQAAVDYARAHPEMFPPATSPVVGSALTAIPLPTPTSSLVPIALAAAVGVGLLVYLKRRRQAR